MDVRQRNELLAQGILDHLELWPKLTELKTQKLQFKFEFGLDTLPKQAGLLVIRGPRQYGKSTWLEQQLYQSCCDYGAGSSFYLNGDELVSAQDFDQALIYLQQAFNPKAKQKRIFIDEITTIEDWQRVIKKKIDRGEMQDVLLITTGSKAKDLRRASERLPGRKGKLAKSDYLFLPVSFRQFYQQTKTVFGENTWIAYLLSGGSPLACNELFLHQRIPDYFIQLMRDWIIGEIVGGGRSRILLNNLTKVLFKYGGQVVGFAKLARETGMANNTVALGYIEQLADLMSVLPAWPVDPNSLLLMLRKPAKFHFINLAVAIALASAHINQVEVFLKQDPQIQGMHLEWLVAQELWRRSVLAKVDDPEQFGFWQNEEHAIDFVDPQGNFIEVKRGRASSFEFGWFHKVFPKQHLTVITRTPFDSQFIHGVTIEQFLLA